MCMEEYNLRYLFQQTSGGLRLAEQKRTGFRFGGAGRRQAGCGWTLGALPPPPPLLSAAPLP